MPERSITNGGGARVPASIGGVGAEVVVGGEVVVEDLEVKVLLIRRDGELQPVGGELQPIGGVDFLVLSLSGDVGGRVGDPAAGRDPPYRSSGVSWL